MTTRARAKQHRRIARIVAYSAVAIVVIFAGTLAAVAIARSPEVPTSTRSPYVAGTGEPSMRNPTVIYIGDSFVGGSEMGGVGTHNFSYQAGPLLGWDTCTFGVGGSGWTRGLNGWTFGSRVDWALSQNPGALVFVNAITDLSEGWQNVAPAAHEVLADIRSRSDVPVVVVGPIKVRDEQSPAIDRMNESLRTVAAQFSGVTYIDATEEGWFEGEGRELIGEDRFHPTNEGHLFLAKKFAESVKSHGLNLAQQTSEEKVYCSAPDWRRFDPSGAPVPAPTATESPSS